METNTLSRRVRSPEDIQVGYYITVTHTTYHLLPQVLEARVGGEVELLRATTLAQNAGEPLEVVALSLPFVMAESVNGRRSAIDTRCNALAWVDRDYALAGKDRPIKPGESKRQKKRRKSDKHKKTKR